MSKWLQLTASALAKQKPYEKRHDFLDRLPEKEAEAVMLAGIRTQMGLGGLKQWVDNGYAVELQQLVELLRKINGVATNAYADALEKLEPFLFLRLRGFGLNYWKTENNQKRLASLDEEPPVATIPTDDAADEQPEATEPVATEPEELKRPKPDPYNTYGLADKPEQETNPEGEALAAELTMQLLMSDVDHNFLKEVEEYLNS